MKEEMYVQVSRRVFKKIVMRNKNSPAYKYVRVFAKESNSTQTGKKNFIKAIFLWRYEGRLSFTKSTITLTQSNYEKLIGKPPMPQDGVAIISKSRAEQYFRNNELAAEYSRKKRLDYHNSVGEHTALEVPIELPGQTQNKPCLCCDFGDEK